MNWCIVVIVAKVGSLAEIHPDMVKEWHSIKNDSSTLLDITAGKFKKAWWLCSKCGYKWEASPANQKGVGCPHCAGRVRMPNVDDFALLYPELDKDWDYETNDNLSPDMFLHKSGKYVNWKCHKCRYAWKAPGKQN